MRSLTTYTPSLFCLILLFLLSVSTGAAVVAHSPQDGPLDLDDLGDIVLLPHTPSISPDGRSIVYGRKDEAGEKEGEERHNRSFEVGDNSYLTRSEPRPTPNTGAFIRWTIQLLELESGERRVLTGTWGRGLAFSPDGRLLTFISSRSLEPTYRVPSSVFVVSREGGEPRDVTPGIDRDLRFAAWLSDGSGLLVKGADVTRRRVWLQPLDGPARPLDLGPVNPTTDLSLSDDGRAAFIGLEPQRPFELYVMDSPEVSPQRITDLNGALASRGWLVFQPNYRGNNNQGMEFQRAVAGAAVTDWFDQYSSSDINTGVGFGLGGSPWLNDNAENYWRQSPMAYAHQIRTPTLILSTTGDERVPVSQSYKLYHVLKDNEVEVQFIAYPVGGHWPNDPVHTRDVLRRWIDWIEEHFDRRANP